MTELVSHYNYCVNTFTSHFIATYVALPDAVGRFYSMPSREIGRCYASRVFAVGEFDAAGGVLTLDGCDSVKLVIPPNALSGVQLIYLMIQFENNPDDDCTANLSPTFECGPDGLTFNVREHLHLK